MAKLNKIPYQVRMIIFVAVIITMFFGVGVIAGNLSKISNVKIAFSNNHEINVLTTKTTVEEILKENHIELLEDEIVVPSLDSEITGDATITIAKESNISTIAMLASKGANITIEELEEAYTPIVEKIIIEDVEIPFETVTKDISNGDSDTIEAVVQQGKNGLKRVKYSVKFKNDIEIERTEISSEIVKEPQNKVVQIRVKPTVTSRGTVGRADIPAGGLASLVEGITPQVVTLNASSYCPCMQCCGKTNAVTASGKIATPWYTVAAGKGYPFGTVIYIPALSNKPNGGWFVVQDRGGAISNSKLDIFVSTHSEALNFGRRNLECYIYVF